MSGLNQLIYTFTISKWQVYIFSGWVKINTFSGFWREDYVFRSAQQVLVITSFHSLKWLSRDQFSNSFRQSLQEEQVCVLGVCMCVCRVRFKYFCIPSSRIWVMPKFSPQWCKLYRRSSFLFHLQTKKASTRTSAHRRRWRQNLWSASAHAHLFLSANDSLLKVYGDFFFKEKRLFNNCHYFNVYLKVKWQLQLTFFSSNL